MPQREVAEDRPSHRRPDDRRARGAPAPPPREQGAHRRARDPRKGGGFLRRGDRSDPVVIFGFMERQKADHHIATMARTLGVSRSGLYARRTRPKTLRAMEDEVLLDMIARIHASSRGTYARRASRPSCGSRTASARAAGGWPASCAKRASKGSRGAACTVPPPPSVTKGPRRLATWCSATPRDPAECALGRRHHLRADPRRLPLPRLRPRRLHPPLCRLGDARHPGDRDRHRRA